MPTRPKCKLPADFEITFFLYLLSLHCQLRQSSSDTTMVVSIALSILVWLRFKVQVGHSNLSTTLTTDQKWIKNKLIFIYVHISHQNGSRATKIEHIF